MKRLLTPLFIVALVAAVLTACNSPSRVLAAGLGVGLTAIEPQTDGTVKVAWHISNSNIVSYLVSQVTMEVSLNGVTLGTIEDREPLPVLISPRSGRTAVLHPTPAAATWLQTRPTSARYEANAKITLLLYGDESAKVRLSNTGTVSITSSGN